MLLKKDYFIYNITKIKYGIKKPYILNELTVRPSGYYAYFIIFITIREYTVLVLINTRFVTSFILLNFAKRIKILLKTKKQEYELRSAIKAIAGVIYKTVLIRISL